MGSKITLTNNTFEDFIKELTKNHRNIKTRLSIHGDIEIEFSKDLNEEDVTGIKTILREKLPNMKVSKHEKT